MTPSNPDTQSIFVAVGGRFHADRMVTAFAATHPNVRLLTTFPRSKFAIPAHVRSDSFLLPEVLYRGLARLGLRQTGERAKMRVFGRWLAARCTQLTGAKGEGASGIIWSSFAQETFERRCLTKNILMRDSTHIEHQMQVLTREGQKHALPYHADRVCIERELAEYQLADHILVLSQFAKKTFVDRGISPAKLTVLPLGVNRDYFKPLERPPKITLPLRVLYFGTLSIRKGTSYLLEATKHFSPKELKLTLIGPVESGFENIIKRYSHFTYHPAMPHAQLGMMAREHHVYLFPSLEDGFPNTLIQAMASGLVPISTNECGPAELITHGRNGFHIASASTEAISDLLSALCREPERLHSLRADVARTVEGLSWENYGEQLRAAYQSFFRTVTDATTQKAYATK